MGEVSFNFPNRNASGFCSPNHIGGSPPAGKGNDQVRLAFVNHPLISYRASGATVPVPFRHVLFWLCVITAGPYMCQVVSASSATGNHGANLFAQSIHDGK
jgi:hypothetical protein